MAEELPGSGAAGERLVSASAETAEAAPAPSRRSRPAHKDPEQIGPYRILECLGEGGMGIVYKAEQRTPVRRIVALKVIKLGMDTKEVVARFEAERQALALMSHPNVAKVFEAGVTDQGRPYFAMEHVPGVPLTEYCDVENLSTRQRLELFMPVCQAIQHAHQKGIIHRDLKPSNILVTLFEGSPVPKVIDFGIAKATNQALTQHTLYTQTGAMVGTPEYMSPEQAMTSGLDVDTRTDIYSLGVILYELLTGTLPFDPQTLRQAGLEGMARIIKESEPARPSVRLTQARVETLKRRRADVHALERELRGDLDWITLKAMEKDRTRRYETANGLASDIGRHLRTEPVLAGPPTATYKLQKFAQRNRAGIAVAAVILVALVGGLGAAIFGLRSAREQRDIAWRAQQDEASQRRAAQAAQRDALEKLWSASFSQARAGRFGGRMGRRFESLAALSVAAGIRPTLELRNEAIACMMLADIRPVRQWPPTLAGDHGRAFDEQLRRYAIAGTAGSITVRRTDDEGELLTLPGTGTSVGWMMRFSPDGRFLVANYNDPPVQLKVWDLASRQPVLTRGAEVTPEGIDFNSDGTLLAIAKADSSIEILEMPSFRLLRTLHTNFPARLVRFQPQGRWLAVSSHDGQIQVRTTDTGKLVRSFRGPTMTHWIAWHPDGNRLAGASADFKTYVWDAMSGVVVTTMEGHQSDVIRAAFNHGGQLLATGSWDGTLRLWDAATGKQLLSTRDFGTFLQFSRDDSRLAFGGRGATLCELSTAPEYRTLWGHIGGKGPVAADFSPDGRWAATASFDGVRFWDTFTGRELGLLPLPGSRTVRFANDGTSVLTSGATGLLRWPIRMDEGHVRRASIDPPQQLLGAAGESALSADGHRVVSILAGGMLGVVDADRPKDLLLLGGAAGIDHIALSPDGRWIAGSTTGFELVRVWDVQAPGLPRNLPILRRAPFPVFSPDGHWLVLGPPEHYSFFEVGPWRALHQIGRAGSSLPGRMAFSPDGQTLAIAYSNLLVRLVDPSDGKELASLEAPETPLLSGLYFSRDGTRLIATSENHLSQVWNLRVIRRSLAAMHLDWPGDPLPEPLAPAPQPGEEPRLTVAAQFEYSGVNPIDSIRIADPNDPELLAARADQYAHIGHFKESAADYHQLTRLKPLDHWNWYLCAVLDLYLGDRKAYETDCSQMLNRFSATQAPEVAERTAKVCLLVSDGPWDRSKLMALADRCAAAGAPAELLPWFQMTKGLADYRAENFAEAVERLQKLSVGPAPPSRLVTVQSYLVMAYQKLGRAGDAAPVEKARREILKYLASVNNLQFSGESVVDRLVCEIACREFDAERANEPPAQPAGTGMN